MPTRVALIVLLALQLALGSLVQVSHAATHGAGKTAVSTATTAAHADSHAECGGKHATGKQQSGDNHDCCRASACQCSCLQTPAVPDLLAFNDTPTSSALPQLPRAPVVAPRIDEFLRPPIA